MSVLHAAFSMPISDKVSSVLWLSELSSASDLRAVKQIWNQSRQRNAKLALTGAMVFDGERFCELLEGQLDDISAAYRDLEFDTRLTGLRVLHASATPGKRRFSNWQSGYCDGSDLDVFIGENALQGEEAAAAFMALLPRCDMLPG